MASSGGLTVLHESWQLEKDLEWFLKTTHWDILRDDMFVSHILRKVLLHAHEGSESPTVLIECQI